MRISYCGQIEGTKFNTRVAEIDFSEKEESTVRRIADIADKETGWKKWSFFADGIDGDGSAYVSVDDRDDDYNDFKEFYLETKRSLKEETKKERERK